MSAGGNKPGEGQGERKKKESILDLSRFIDKQIRVKFAGGRECSGLLKGYDPLLNIVLDDTIEYLRDPDDAYKLTQGNNFNNRLFYFYFYSCLKNTAKLNIVHPSFPSRGRRVGCESVMSGHPHPGPGGVPRHGRHPHLPHGRHGEHRKPLRGPGVAAQCHHHVSCPRVPFSHCIRYRSVCLYQISLLSKFQMRHVGAGEPAPGHRQPPEEHPGGHQRLECCQGAHRELS